MNKELERSFSRILRSLIKNGHSSFSLEILEYCEPENAVSREQYYLDLLKPEYNICDIAGSILGFIHTEESIEKIRAYGFGRVKSEETRAKMESK
jgi:group I intron endonuclease